jgi:hypothetical protein
MESSGAIGTEYVPMYPASGAARLVLRQDREWG